MPRSPDLEHPSILKNGLLGEAERTYQPLIACLEVYPNTDLLAGLFKSHRSNVGPKRAKAPACWIAEFAGSRIFRRSQIMCVSQPL